MRWKENCMCFAVYADIAGKNDKVFKIKEEIKKKKF